jgi:hypothetical protein
MEIEGEVSKRYRLSYGGQSLGSYDTAKEAVVRYDSHNKLIRPVTDPKNKWRYDIFDGRTKEITIAELSGRAKAEG